MRPAGPAAVPLPPWDSCQCNRPRRTLASGLHRVRERPRDATGAARGFSGRTTRLRGGGVRVGSKTRKRITPRRLPWCLVRPPAWPAVTPPHPASRSWPARPRSAAGTPGACCSNGTRPRRWRRRWSCHACGSYPRSTPAMRTRNSRPSRMRSASDCWAGVPNGNHSPSNPYMPICAGVNRTWKPSEAEPHGRPGRPAWAATHYEEYMGIGPEGAPGTAGHHAWHARSLADPLNDPPEFGHVPSRMNRPARKPPSQ